MHEVHAYLSKKWGLTATVDSDGDGFSDAIEIGEGTIVTDANSVPTDIPATVLTVLSYGWMLPILMVKIMRP